MSNRITRTGLALLAFLGFSAGSLAAQACLGSPAAPGQIAVQGTAAFTDGQKRFGAGTQANLEGPLSVGGRYALVTLDDVDTNGHSFGATAAYELPGFGLSLCPYVGFDYLTMSESELGASARASILEVPAGFALGTSFLAGDGLTVTPFAAPHVLLMRYSTSISGLGEEFDESFSDTETELGAALGASVGLEQLYLTGNVSFNTLDGSDPVFGVGLGFLF